MAPQQCPNCGRFLRNALVQGLADGPAPCPGCGTELTADTFGVAAGTDPASVRPPDLPPAEVRDDRGDVLTGWDVDADAEELAGWRDDRAPFPTDALAVASSAAGGALLGAILLRRRIVGALLGGILGALVAGIVRQLWRAPD